MTDNNGLREFIEAEMQKREMNIRKFAEFVDVAHTTISRAIDPRGNVEPSLEFLEKLAIATNTDICTLVALVKPNATRGINPRVKLLAERINSLSPEKQEFIDDFILGALLKQSQKNG